MYHVPSQCIERENLVLVQPRGLIPLCKSSTTTTFYDVQPLLGFQSDVRPWILDTWILCLQDSGTTSFGNLAPRLWRPLKVGSIRPEPGSSLVSPLVILLSSFIKQPLATLVWIHNKRRETNDWNVAPCFHRGAVGRQCPPRRRQHDRGYVHFIAREWYNQSIEMLLGCDE